jgi:hypothetical protein
LRLRAVRERYAARKRNKTQEENILYRAEQAKRQRKARQQETPEKREERRRKNREYYQIRRAAEEAEADLARRRVEEMHQGIRLIEEKQEVAGLIVFLASTSDTRMGDNIAGPSGTQP